MKRILQFRQIINSKIEYQKLLRLLVRLKVILVRHLSMRQGVVMSDQDLTDYIPLKYGE